MEIRRSYDPLVSTMGFPILVTRYLYIESGPRILRPRNDLFIVFFFQESLGLEIIFLLCFFPGILRPRNNLFIAFFSRSMTLTSKTLARWCSDVVPIISAVLWSLTGVLCPLSELWDNSDKRQWVSNLGAVSNIKMSSYQYRDPRVKDKTVLRPSYL